MGLNFDLILASASPRRKDILHQMGVRYRAEPSEIDEDFIACEKPFDYVSRLARKKTIYVQKLTNSTKPVLGADTIVVLGGEIFGKPKNKDDAQKILMTLSGKNHKVITAVAITDGKSLVQDLSVSEVVFNIITLRDCKEYCESGEPFGKAGAYAIQGKGAFFVKEISGSYSGIVGLPIDITYKLLQLYEVPTSWTVDGVKGVRTVAINSEFDLK